MRGIQWRHSVGYLATCVILLSIHGCGDDGVTNPCLPSLPRLDQQECNAAFPPTFDRTFSTLRTRCGSSGSLCHTAGGMAGGLVLVRDAAEAHQMLTAPDHGAPSVIPGDPECSPLMARLESDDPRFQMPQGRPLSAQERCAIIQWIADGAEP